MKTLRRRHMHLLINPSGRFSLYTIANSRLRSTAGRINNVRWCRLVSTAVLILERRNNEQKDRNFTDHNRFDEQQFQRRHHKRNNGRLNEERQNEQWQNLMDDVMFASTTYITIYIKIT